MALSKNTTTVNNIQTLTDITLGQATAVKVLHDKAGSDIKTYINDVLTVEIDTLDSANVKETGDQTIAGVKTFEESPIVPTPTTDMQASTKKYVDDTGASKTIDLNTHKTSSDHDGRYYTEVEIAELLAAKTNFTGNHNGTWQGYTPTQTSPGIQAVVDSHSAQLADIPNQSYITEKAKQIDVASAKAGILKDLDLNWVIGGLASGVLNYNMNAYVTTEGYIQLDSDIFVILKNSNCQFQIAYYTTSGVFASYSSWYTSSYIIPTQENRKIRILLKYPDTSTFSSMYPLVHYVSAFKKNVDVIPSYWLSTLGSKIETIKTLQKNIGYNGTSFAFITDIHIKNNSQNNASLLKRVMEDCEIPYYFDGGDFTTGASNTSKLQQLEEIDFIKRLFKPLESSCIRALGNHDDNSIDALYSKTVIENEMYNTVYRQNAKYSQYKNGKTGEYFYIDDEMNKIRYITLNCIDIPYVLTANDTLQYSGMTTWAFRQVQVDWFADIALNVPNDTWSVVVCSHIPINQGYITNDSIVMNILQAFKDKTTYTGSGSTTDFAVSKTVNYTGKGGDVICWIAGHLHVDSYVTLPGNITYKEVTTLNDSLDVVAGQPTKTLGTNTENAFDIFTINKTTKTVNITRIGAGSDRSFTY